MTIYGIEPRREVGEIKEVIKMRYWTVPPNEASRRTTIYVQLRGRAPAPATSKTTNRGVNSAMESKKWH